jgi:hypothetical protein
MKTHELFSEAIRRNIRLIPNGSKLIVESVGDLDRNFEKVLIRNKPALLKFLQAKRHLVRQIYCGEFDGSSASTSKVLIEALDENCFDPVCQRAIEHLKATIRQRAMP